MSVRAGVRHQVLNILAGASSLTGRLSAGLNQNRVQFLYLHQLFPQEESAFRKLLSVLGRRHQFIGYSEAVQRVAQGRTDGRFIAVSFDDGLKSSLRAARILRELGISACFFVCPSIIGELDSNKIQAFCRRRLHLPPMEFLSWMDLEKLAGQGHEIGSHTLSHPRLADLPASEIQHEIGSSFEILNKRLGPIIRHFAWPYGRFSDITPAGVNAVFESGFHSCASAVRGCHISQTPLSQSRLCLRRDHLRASWPPRHVEYFLARNVLAFTPEKNGWPPGWAEEPATASL